MKVEVLRPFCIRGERQDVGKTVDVADVVGRELIYMGRARAVEPKAAKPKAGPMTTATAGTLVAGAATAKE